MRSKRQWGMQYTITVAVLYSMKVEMEREWEKEASYPSTTAASAL